MPDTKTKILDSAEKLFAELGIDGASLRAITEAAGVNLGGIYYYFENKEDLVAEVLGRRADQFSRERLVQLEAMKKYNLRPTIRELWLVMVGPMLEFGRRYPEYMKLIQYFQVFREKALFEVFLDKTHQFEKTMLELLSSHFPAHRQTEALKRCQVLLLMLYQVIMNYNMVKLSLNNSNMNLTDVQFAEQTADIASAALQEFIED